MEWLQYRSVCNLRYDAAVQTVLDLMDGNLSFDEVNLDSISELKGMFNRCIRQDQWDWFSVFTELGTPPHKNMREVADALRNLRRAVAERDNAAFDRLKQKLIASNFLYYLDTYQSGLSKHICEPGAGWVYILSTREQPDVLKIGMTRRSVSQRVKEINSATGVLIPFAARYVFRVKNAVLAEKDIFELLAKFRIRPDREFFKLPFSEAVSMIQQYLAESRMRHRLTSTLLWFDQEKRYGFILVKDSEDVFVHSSQISKVVLSQLTPGIELEFDLGKRPQGLCALNVSLLQQNST